MTPSEVAERVRELVVAHPEVVTLYSAQPVAVDVASRALTAIVPRAELPERVRVSQGEDGTTVSLHIGVSGERSASDVCRELHDLIALDLAAEDTPGPLSISVTVSSVG